MIKHRKICNFKNWDCFFFRVIQWYSCWLPLQLNHIVCNPIIQKFGLFNHFQGIHMANIFRIFGLEKNTMLGELQIRLSYVHMKNWWFFQYLQFFEWSYDISNCYCKPIFGTKDSSVTFDIRSTNDHVISIAIGWSGLQEPIFRFVSN